ncbi:carboxymuconolactone decarboxylase family protein [Sphingobium sp. 3R8]|uniref:carboxymuconolactone decarboxylase family protein n=1 Tax=Sphingobium sp. 3R8 TaxID=2874921 RepID=UPI001CC8FF3D|nr:carboxymuconolactone decarboxylase family protein [Sphingobium sp. 3R8]MBZ9648377.1 carboxymuconolactone decarboxylase family protein [Sphingobium sp. 3R8]
MTDAQKIAAAIVAQGPRGSVRGPFAILLNSPGAFGAVQALGTYLRFESTIPANLRELAILATARHWRQEYEWQVHAVIAQEEGLSTKAIASIAAGFPIEDASAEEELIHAFCSQLHNDNGVDDATYARIENLLGREGVIDLSAICGYYALLAMVMNVARNPVPTGTLFPAP